MAYAETTELIRILKLRNVTDDQTAALDRVLEAAAGEIDAEIDLAADAQLDGWMFELLAEVNLERAVEHWQQQEVGFGLIGIAGEFGGATSRTATNSWERHANKLAPVKNQWGLA